MKKTTPINSSELICQLNKGNELALEQLFGEFAPKLYCFAKNYTGDAMLAEEIVQDTFFKIWQKRESVKDDKSFKSYLFTIAFNLIRKYFLQKSREEKYKQAFADEFLVNDDQTDEQMLYDEMVALVDRVIEKLPERRREIFILSRKEGMSIAAIALRFNITERTVKNQLTAAKNFVIEELSSDGNPRNLLFYWLFVGHRKLPGAG